MRRAGIAAIAVAWLAAAACAGAAVAGGAEQDPAITVIGNRHIGADMIRSFFHAGPDGQYDAAARDAALKALYASGLFTDAKISHEGNRILVVVVENSTIEVVAFEGSRKPTGRCRETLSIASLCVFSIYTGRTAISMRR